MLEVIIRVTLVLNSGVTLFDLVLSVLIGSVVVALLVGKLVLFERLLVVCVTVVNVMSVLVGTLTVEEIVEL